MVDQKTYEQQAETVASVMERPILFSGAMVRAIRALFKTQTRRPIKPQPIEGDVLEVGIYAPTMVDRYGEEYPGPKGWGAHSEYECIRSPYGQPGDRLWVRESFRLRMDQDEKPTSDDWWKSGTWYEADGLAAQPSGCAGGAGKLRPGIFMPRWASRITLEITEIRVQRLQEISEEDAKAEGIEEPVPVHGAWVDPRQPGRMGHWSYRKPFCELWESINGKGSWEANPWIWALTFRKLDGVG